MNHILKKTITNSIYNLILITFISAIFILIGNRNFIFIAVMNYTNYLSVNNIFFDTPLLSALPISRKDIVKGNYLTLIFSAIGVLIFTGTALMIAEKLFHLDIGNNLSLTNILGGVIALSLHSIFISPFYLIMTNKMDNNNSKMYGRLWVVPYIIVIGLILLLRKYYDQIATINGSIQITFTLVLALFIYIGGIIYSTKKIKTLDF